MAAVSVFGYFHHRSRRCCIGSSDNEVFHVQGELSVGGRGSGGFDGADGEAG
jgi:hypothetical protein